jgi:uncharacterized protein (UPF0248 family)
MHAPSLYGYYKSEAIEPHAIVNIVRSFGELIYKRMRQSFLYKVTDI